MRQFSSICSSIQSVKKFVQDFVPDNCPEIKKVISLYMNHEHFIEQIASFVHSSDLTKLLKNEDL